MSDPSLPSEATPASSAAVLPPPTVAAQPVPSAPRQPWGVLVGVALLALAALAVAVLSQQRMRSLEQELVKRQQLGAEQVAEARLLAKQAQEWSQDAVAKATLLETRVSEVALQRGQLEELIQSLSRSRDENLVADIESGVRVALQQTAITGSAEPLVAALKAADERLARVEQARLEPVRRAIARDIERIQAVSVTDIASLAVKLDEAVRLVDEAPLLVLDAPRFAAPAVRKPAAAAPAAPAASAVDAAASMPAWLPPTVLSWWRGVWGEARGLLRVVRIDQPEAMLLAPEQSYFLRENLKLKLLNARLALLSRQFQVAQADLQGAITSTERYFDRDARKSAALVELLRGVAVQSRQVGVPRPDDTLAALTAAAAGR